MARVGEGEFVLSVAERSLDGASYNGERLVLRPTGPRRAGAWLALVTAVLIVAGFWAAVLAGTGASIMWSFFVTALGAGAAVLAVGRLRSRLIATPDGMEVEDSWRRYRRAWSEVVSLHVEDQRPPRLRASAVGVISWYPSSAVATPAMRMTDGSVIRLWLLSSMTRRDLGSADQPGAADTYRDMLDRYRMITRRATPTPRSSR